MRNTTLTVLGVTFLLIGLWGFLQDPVLGIFEVDTLHNIIHLLSGVLALIFAFQSEGAQRIFSMTFAVVYGLIAVIGFISGDIVLGMEMNAADDVLHLLLALTFVYAGWRSPALNRT